MRRAICLASDRSAPVDARRIVAARALRGFADGAVSVLLASYLSLLALTPFEIGAIITGTLLGPAALTLAVGLFPIARAAARSCCGRLF